MNKISRDAEKKIVNLNNLKTKNEELGHYNNKEMLRNLARFLSMVEITPSGIMVADEDENIVLTNQAFCDIFSIKASPGELVGIKCTKTADANKHLLADPETFPRRIGEILKNRSSVIAEEIFFTNGSAYERDYIPVFSENNAFIGHMWQYRDITRHKKAEEDLRNRDQLLQLITRLANSFINIPENQIDASINKALKEIGLFIEVDRVYLFSHDLDRKITTNTHEWRTDGISPQIEKLREISFEMFPKIVEKQIKGEIIYYPRVSDMPHTDPARGFFENEGTQSVVMLPTMHGNQCLGFVGFDAVKNIRFFSAIEINLLKILAELLTNAELRKRNEQLLRSKEEEIFFHNMRLETLFKNSTDAIACVDENNRVIDINNNFNELFGYKLEEIKGLDFDDALDFGKAKTSNRSYTERVFGGEKIVAEGTRFTKEGFPVEVMVKGIPISIDSKLCGAYIIYTDITDRKQTEEALRKSEKIFGDILASIEDGFFEVDLKGNITFCNEASARMLGYSVDEFKGMNFQGFCKDVQVVFNAFNQVFLTGKTEHALDFEMIKKDGSDAYAELSVSLVQDVQGNIIGFQGIGRDVTERKHYEDQLKYLSFHGQLTGLYNRAYFENELGRLAHSREYPVSIISIDLDGLKLVNDTIGHQQGDQMLIACAKLLKKTVRGFDIIARIGGDEFVVLLPQTSSKKAKTIAERFNAQLETYNLKRLGQVPLSVSLGLATADDRNTSLQKTYKEADDLMYRDKLQKGVDARSQVIMSFMASLGEKDFIAEGHAGRLGDLCTRLGKKIKLPEKALSDLALLARGHNLGKVGVPDSILLTKGPLSDEQWQTIKQHPEKGYRIASSSTDLSGIADLILKHHERWDGSGYPLGISGNNIPVECRILAIADAYDAMTSDRPYRKAMSREDAVNELQKNAGTQFDPGLIESFLQILEN